MALDPNGLTVKRFREVVEDVQARLDAGDTNIVITDESNKVANNIGDTFCLSLAEIYEFVEEIYNAFDVRSATGVALDRLVIYKAIEREQEEFSSGLVEFFANGQFTVNTNVQARDTRGRNLFCTEDRTVGSGSFRTFNIPFDPLEPATDTTKYYIVLSGVEFAYTTTTGETLNDVMVNLSSEIATDSKYNTVLTSGNLEVLTINENNTSVLLFPDFTIGDYSSLIGFRAEEAGELQFPSNTITTLVTTLTQVSSITNPSNFDEGRLEETDEELRARFLATGGAVGRSTIDSIIKGVEQVSGVDEVSLINNPEDAVSPEGLPPKSYEVIAEGGEDQDIADAILAFGPAGIETFGTISVPAFDSKGVAHPIKFTRPSNLYIFVNVEYEKYEEFSQFPVDGEDQMKQAIVDNGVNYQANQDVIPSSLQVPIYQSVTGVGEMKITCGYSSDPLATVPDTGYSEDRVIVGIRDIAIFESSRITVTETPIP